MANPWRELGSTVISAGRLWLPQMSIAFMRRDYGISEQVTDHLFEEDTWVTVANGVDEDTGIQFAVHFPASWEEDESLANMTVTLDVAYEAKLSAGTLSYLSIEPKSGTFPSDYTRDDTMNTISASYAAYHSSVTLNGIPQGWVLFEFIIKTGATTGNTLSIRRTSTSFVTEGGCLNTIRYIDLA